MGGIGALGEYAGSHSCLPFARMVKSAQPWALTGRTRNQHPSLVGPSARATIDQISWGKAPNFMFTLRSVLVATAASIALGSSAVLACAPAHAAQPIVTPAHSSGVTAKAANVLCRDHAAKTVKHGPWLCMNGELRTRKGSKVVARTTALALTNRAVQYTHQTTENYAAYGYNSKVVGTLKVKLKTSLNGRSARWQVIITKLSGPGVVLTNLFINCREQRWGPDGNCGQHAADNANGTVSLTSSWQGPWVQGNYLANSNPYRADLSGYLQPVITGGQRIVMQTLASRNFYCWGGSNDRCYFEV